MQYIRKNGMIDINEALSSGKIVFDEFEKHGTRKNKFWFNHYQWMYKDTCNEYETYEEYAELICYELAKLFQIECAEYDLATYNGNKGVITKSVVKENEKIVSGTELLSTVFDEYFYLKQKLYENYKELIKHYTINSIEELQKLPINQQQHFWNHLIKYYNQSCFSIKDIIFDPEKVDKEELFDYCKKINDVYPNDFKDMKNGILYSNNLYDIWSAIEIYCKISGYEIDTEKAMNDLINIFFFDIITSQGDRHADNWSIIIDKDNRVRIAGLYDNSGALALNREKAIANINDLSERLKKEMRPAKSKGIYRQLKNTIEHSFSGIKVSYEQVLSRSKNDDLIEMFVSDSSYEFSERLLKFAELITDDNLEKIWKEIEQKTGVPVPQIVKNVTQEVLLLNCNKIKEIIAKKEGKENEIKEL